MTDGSSGASSVTPPRHLLGPRNPGDAWVESPDGRRFWGRFGAAGVLAVDPRRGAALQHRAVWSHFGGTWGIPGGARHEGEDAVTGALREAEEEAGLSPDSLTVVSTTVLDLGFWSYTTVLARAAPEQQIAVTDPESLAVRWVPLETVEALPLHPGFAASWPGLLEQWRHRPTLVVDSANVVGSRPDGWWRDRRGAAERLTRSLNRLARRGFAARALELPGDRWYPPIVQVVEGAATGAASPADPGAPYPTVTVVAASGPGDDEIVRQADLAARSGAAVIVVTADRELAGRVQRAGMGVRGPSWLREQLDGGEDR